MPASDKMTKCRNCNKDVKVADVESPDFTCDCGWNEAKAKADAKAREHAIANAAAQAKK